MANGILPRNRLNVFISSAQREEDGLHWEELRGKISTALRECPYLNPFIIEENVSELSSTQHFLYNVKRSDVVVLLVKGDVRPGTELELTAAIKEKKPVLLYFLKGETLTEEAERVKRTIQNNDYCTYVQVDSFEGIEDRIRQDIVENLIEYYQFNHYQSSNMDVDPEVSMGLSEEIRTTAFYAPTKAALSLFESAYEHIFDLLDMAGWKKVDDAELSVLHNLGVSALDWLVLGTHISCEDGIQILLENTQSIFGRTDWLEKRWNAIFYALEGEYEKALKEEQMALTRARAASVPHWIESDILIDCRNLRIEIGNMSSKWKLPYPEQEELDKTETIVYLPIADRYLEEAYGKTIKAEIDLKTSPPSTTHFGSNLSYTIRDFVSYFFSALVYGSFTHMFISRERLIDILYKYSDTLEWPRLLLPALKMLVLCGNSKQFMQIVEYCWDDCYSEIASNADVYWEFAKKAVYPKRSSISISVISILGLYFSDEVFDETTLYIVNTLPSINWRNSEEYLKCIYANLKRFEQESIIDIITGIIGDKKYNLGSTLSKIIINANLDGLPTEKQQRLYDALKDNLPSIIDRNGSPQLVAVLRNFNPDIFAKLAEIPNNGLHGIEKLYYDLNTGKGDIKEVLLEMMATAHSQYETNKGGNGFSSFAINPYHTISSIVQNYFALEIVEPINEKFFPLCKEVLESNVPLPVKDDCCSCLCDVLAVFKENGLEIPGLIISVISGLEPDNTQGFYLNQYNTELTFSCRILLLKVITGLAKKEDLIGWSIQFSKMNPTERVVLVDSIEKFLKYEEPKQDSIDGVILAIILQCLEDNYYEVRARACDCLVYFVNSSYSDIARQKLIETTLDSSHWVRNRLLRICRHDMISEQALNNQIIEILRRDANYAIRTIAQSS